VDGPVLLGNLKIRHLSTVIVTQEEIIDCLRPKLAQLLADITAADRAKFIVIKMPVCYLDDPRGIGTLQLSLTLDSRTLKQAKDFKDSQEPAEKEVCID